MYQIMIWLPLPKLVGLQGDAIKCVLAKSITMKCDDKANFTEGTYVAEDGSEVKLSPANARIVKIMCSSFEIATADWRSYHVQPVPQPNVTEGGQA